MGKSLSPVSYPEDLRIGFRNRLSPAFRECYFGDVGNSELSLRTHALAAVTCGVDYPISSRIFLSNSILLGNNASSGIKVRPAET